MICYRELMKTTSVAYMKRCSKCTYAAPLIRMFYLLMNSQTINLVCCEISSKMRHVAQTSKQPILPIRAGPVTESLCWEDAPMIKGKALVDMIQTYLQPQHWKVNPSVLNGFLDS